MVPFTITITTLPHEIILQIVSNLSTARDVSHLGLACRSLHATIHTAGWQVFVRSCFPTLDHDLPRAAGQDGPGWWRECARTMTWQNWCWERRALQMGQIYHPQTLSRGRQRRSHLWGQSATTATYVDAALMPNGEEIFAVSSSDDVSVFVRPLRAWDALQDKLNPGKMLRLDNNSEGSRSYTSDVTALRIVERRDEFGLVVGRLNGDLHLVSIGENSLDENVSRLAPDLKGHTSSTAGFAQQPPTQRAIANISQQPGGNLVSATDQIRAFLYDVDSIKLGDSAPTQTFDVLSAVGAPPRSFVREVKFMSHDRMGCALAGAPYPLSWFQVTPSGLTVSLEDKAHALGKNITDMHDRNGYTTVRSIEAIPMSSSSVEAGNYLLTAWEDGECRLLDVRTPRAWDAIYHDLYAPYEPQNALLVYGFDRFIAGNKSNGALKIFDFRFPRPYDYAAGQPCSERLPYPARERPTLPRSDQRLAGSIDKWNVPRESRCNHMRGTFCPWHAAAKERRLFRPDVTILPFNRHMREETVYSLAKSSNISGTFYAGFRGYAEEYSLASKGLQGSSLRDRYLSAYEPYWDVFPRLHAILETDTAYGPHDSRTAEALLPQIRNQKEDPYAKGWLEKLRVEESELLEMHRLDVQWHMREDFKGVYDLGEVFSYR